MDQAFYECTGLKELQIPASISNLTGDDVFRGVKEVDRLTLLGSKLSWRVIRNIRDCLTPTAKVVGPELVGRKFGRFTITAT
jgi:hypothetical protein